MLLFIKILFIMLLFIKILFIMLLLIHGTVRGGSGQPIRVKKTCGARLCAWADALPESDGECGHVRRPILTSFSLVASSRPPVYDGMVKTQF